MPYSWDAANHQVQGEGHQAYHLEFVMA